MDEPLTADHFAPHIDKVFRVKDGAHALVLTQIDRIEQWKPGPGQRRPFILIFRGDPGNVLMEGLYTLEVEDGPAFELYVMPIQTSARDRQDYQAAFN